VAAVVMTVLAALSTDDGVVLCPFRRCTGGYCPGCGLTRSGGRLLRGDVAGSWRLHPYLLIAVAQVVVLGSVLAVLGSARFSERMAGLWRPLLMINGVAIVAVWLFRMADGSIPVPFAG
jgi:hypothetical protein